MFLQGESRKRARCSYGEQPFTESTGCLVDMPGSAPGQELYCCPAPDCKQQYHHGCQTRHAWSSVGAVFTAPDGKSFTGEEILEDQFQNPVAKRCLGCLRGAVKKLKMSKGMAVVSVAICVMMMINAL